ncbi:hypothetical protein [Sinosporangium siamense]|uniref:Uncharacterized protein n=1 Tax=Sinosporangium siamense TaxID=1367973 RepID=A0A919RBK9_9ACTN|nr:hypothetical protein [Sinosporangium siamense]GII90936.1 hypothetical protein Ssi02_11670 [Sinosporangium siamense]
MTSVLIAAVVVSWAAIALLTFGYAGLVGQIRELQARGNTVRPKAYPDLAAPSAGVRTVALTLTTSCATCETVFDPWLEIERELAANGHRTLVISMDGSTTWTSRGARSVVLAEDLSAPLLLAYQPALVTFDHEGNLLAADPIGSVEGLRHHCSTLQSTSPV